MKQNLLTAAFVFAHEISTYLKQC